MARARLTPEIQQTIQAALSDMQTKGQSLDALIDKDWLLEEGNEAAFMLYYFPRDFAAWEPFNEKVMHYLENYMDVMMLLPAGFGKSTQVLRWMIMVMCREPQISFIFVEKTFPKARERAHYLMQELESNKRLTEHYGEFKSNNWSTESFTIKQRPKLSQEPTVAFFGAGGHGGLGSRCNILLVDDPVTQDNSGSEVERGNLWRWWTQAAGTCPYPLPISNEKYLKKTVLSGTTFHMDDLYHRVAKAGGFEHIHLKAVNDDGSTLSPNRFVYIEKEQLERDAEENEQKQQLYDDIYKSGKVANLHDYRSLKGISAFMRRYQNVVSDPEEQIFPEVWFEGGIDDMAPPGGYPGCWNDKLSLGEPRIPGWKYVTGVDPAGGGKSRDSARFASVTLGMDPENTKYTYLVDLDYGQYPLVSDLPRETQASKVLNQIEEYNSVVALETNNIQGVYDGVLRKEGRKKGMTLRIQGHATTKQRKQDEEMGVSAMAAMVENGMLVLPGRSRRKVQELVTEMTLYGVNVTDDILMAFWFAWRILERARTRSSVVTKHPTVAPAYLRTRENFDFPAHWTDKQKMAYLGYDVDAEEEEVEAL